MKTKKILIVNSHIPWGGLGQFTLSLAQGLNNQGYVINGLVTHSDKDNFENFKQLTSETAYVGHLNKLAKYAYIVWHIYKTKPDVIIINYNAVIHFLLPLLPKSTVVDIIHSDADEFYRISSINHKYVDAWVAPTPGIKDGFIRYSNLPRAKTDTVVISHGIAPSTHLRVQTDNSSLILTFVGAVYEHKGADLLPKIFEKVLVSLPDARLQIIGSGKLEEELKSEFEKKSLINNVEFMGVIPHDEVRKRLSQSDILLFPTRVEAFGLVIAEAMMEGAVPIVTLLHGITDATVEDKKTGFLIPMNDIDTFVEKIIELGQNSNLLIEMSLTCKAVACQQLSLETMSKNYNNLIDKVIHE